jgi:hypothetical protein
MHAGRDAEGERGLGASAPSGDEHVAFWSARMHGLRLGQIVGEEGRDDQLQEASRASMEQPPQSRPGNAAPRPRLCGLAEVMRSDRGIGHGAASAIDHKRAVARPPAFARDVGRHRISETFEEKGAEMEREFGASLTVRRCTIPQARQLGQMAAGGVAVQHLHQG